ncbi:tetratricopeptide repeat protein [Desulfovermiculus halophilus]|jgi:predicted negative regulator of RcsB-dependent stress response|uniref:tetratricopeptide repeat protein n=1 Tax=Desulfovermiculus halophilus TaxID=339722 RepID=UPI000484DF71|nr:tetratricopeptide repeat protein [Desulfovermiculus halophilus]
MSASDPKDPQDTSTSQSASAPAAGWAKVVTDNIKTIGLVIAAVIVVAALVSGYSYYKTRTLRNAQQTVDRIMSEQSGMDRIRGLEEFVPKAPAKMHNALHLQLARLCMEEGAFERAVPHWEHIRENAPDTDLKTVAALGLGTALARMDKSSEALELLRQASGQAPERYQRSLQMKIAAVAEQAGQWEQALKAYRALSDMRALDARPDEFIEHKIKTLQSKAHNPQS